MPDVTRRALIGTAAGAAALTLTSRAVGAATAPKVPLVIAHRGASALRPEHTLAAYAKAIQDGADFIEPDLVVTKDGVLIARHENNIAETTDVARHPEFSARRTRKTVDGEVQDGWFAEDFTLAELKTLRAVERLGKVRPISAGYDGQFQIATFEEIVDFAAAEAAARGRTIGLIPELKHGTYFAGIGLPTEDRLLAVLGAHAYTRRAPVVVQSFEIANLRYLRTKLRRPTNVRLAQLIADGDIRPADVAKAGGTTTFAQMATLKGLRAMATYADIVSPGTRAIIPLRADGRLGPPSTLVRDAHAAGLQVIPWTFRPENRFLAADFRNAAGQDARNPAGSIAEMRRYIATGIDGFFTDDPALGRAALTPAT
ncbi:glycerophosphodiester phosphodiesterase [Sphingomonas arantia]|uniref:glycerophosphodiester phosphodiesterase n=1 Tax=Sphingomonas arantia TaxID=1460676 RepID=A0ABW4TXW3_9SPHN